MSEFPNELEDIEGEGLEGEELEHPTATLLLTGGSRVYLPIGDTPVSIMQAALDSGLSIPVSTVFYVEGVQVDPATTMVAAGMVITGIGNVKGG